ncbi:putative transcription factor C2H2 family [Helianthus annuus]|nr:putative transcription factor C2H2 family [Helianthus annuus]KAJ0658086.1 putative transcription factor C2H2 family [Helianthus annuus]KAJ0842389.1 putative transcription factor C2H2 family [Helianthus annuus]
MAPRKNKNKIIDECETSAAANKRMRMDILNRTNGVPFTSRFNQFPSIHMLQQQQQRNPTQNIGSDLRLAPPSPVPPEDDGFISTLIPQQNFIINYHMNLMVQSVEDFWRRNLAGEIQKRMEMERVLKEKEEQVERFRNMYHFYEERTFVLENMGPNRFAGEGPSGGGAGAALEEEVQSCHVEVKEDQRMEIRCRNCLNRPASMLWLPCRHLSVCLVCERRVKNCPICRVKKTESIQINLP